MKAQVKIIHASFGELVATTRDISDGGIFLITKDFDMPPVGTVIEGQVQGLHGDAPVLKMEIIRAEEDGVGLRFILN